MYWEANNPCLWMAHGHNLMHASMGMSMMLNYEVSRRRTRQAPSQAVFPACKTKSENP
nr:multicopper oxidase domain-containing protein [Paenibacillus artemisiicola]